MTDGRLYIFTGPAVAVLMSSVFLVTWLNQRKRTYVLSFSASFIAYAVAALVQMLHIPDDEGLNALTSGTIYTLCILLMIRGVLHRFEKSSPDRLLYMIGATIVLGMAYFYYVDRSLIARIYLQNFGYGLMLLVAAARIGCGRKRRAIDRLLFWAVLLFGLHFFVRTALTVPLSDAILHLDAMRAAGVDQATRLRLMHQSPFWQILNFTILICGFALALAFLAAVVVDVIDDFRREGGIDALTGLANRRGFAARVQLLLKDARMRPFSIVYCDIDHFKSINDTFGHAAGDEVLRDFAAILESELRRMDVAARFGGEEFVVLLAQARLQQAFRFAERVRNKLSATQFEAVGIRVITASFGVVELGTEEDLEEAIHRADMMVYRAKRSGRNRTRMDDGTDGAAGDDLGAGQERPGRASLS